MHRTIHQDDDCPEMGDWITYAMLGVIQFSAMVAGGIAGNPVITLVGAIVIGVPATSSRRYSGTRGMSVAVVAATRQPHGRALGAARSTTPPAPVA